MSRRSYPESVVGVYVFCVFLSLSRAFPDGLLRSSGSTAAAGLGGDTTRVRVVALHVDSSNWPEVL